MNKLQIRVGESSQRLKNSTKHQNCITVADNVSHLKPIFERVDEVEYICRYPELEDD